MSKLLQKTVLIIIFGLTLEAVASPRPPSPPGQQRKAPIDMGVGILLVSGVALGIKKLKKQ